MRVHQVGPLWLVGLSREETHLKQGLKDVGFRFHWEAGSDKCPRNCLACQHTPAERFVWFTGNSEAGKAVAEQATRKTEPAAEQEVDWGEVHQAADPSRAVDADIQVPCPPGLAYRGFQKAAIQYARSHKNVLIGDEMGLGKTIEVMGIINDTGAKRVLVICPATLRGNWRNELDLWLVERRPIYLPDHVDDLPSYGLPDSCVCVVNAEKLIASKMTTDTGEKGTKERAGGLFQALYNVQWDVLVIDEANRVKNAQAALTRRVIGCHTSKKKEAYGLADRASRLLFLTGTPLPNRPKELWVILNALAPAEFDKEFPFLIRYCDAHKETIFVRGRPGAPAEPKEIWKTDGCSNLPELQRRMRASVMIRRLKANVLKELPPKVRQVLPVTLPDGKVSASAEQEFFADNPEFSEAAAELQLAEALGDPITLAKAREDLEHETAKLQVWQIAKLRQEIAIAKLPVVVEHIKALQEDGAGKVVVMAHHKAVLEGLMQAFGDKAVGIWGDTKQGDREGIVRRFQTDANVTVFVGGILAAGVGITLTAAQTMVFAEIDWVPGNLWQAEDRIHRIGQVGSALIQYLVVDGSIETNILSTVLAKDRTAAAALDTLGKRYDPATPGERERMACALAELVDHLKDKKLCKLPPVPRRILRDLATRQAITDGQVWLATSMFRKHRKLLPKGGAWVFCVGEIK